MVRINQIKLPVQHTREDLTEKIRKSCFFAKGEMFSYEIVRQSIDARKKPEIYFSYVVDVEVPDEKKGKLLRNKKVLIVEEKGYEFPFRCKEKVKAGKRPVIIGFGPAGIFCGYMLAVNGFCPIILERGDDVDRRTKEVERFWKEGGLQGESNVSFGEGGAGTFSDGKLNTLVKDKYGRNKEVLSIFVKSGASENILYDYKPHLGTDVLITVVRNMRNVILECGGEVRFGAKVTGLCAGKDGIRGVTVNGKEEVLAENVILAIGHSARDTYQMLYDKNISMEAKPFAVGLRVEHPQKVINQSQYGILEHAVLGAAPYKLTAASKSGRSVYSFCMCPGGYVVDASSEEGRLAVNGMSYSKRDGENANSAIIVSVTPKDFESDEPLAGIAFQRELEERAFRIGNGKVPVEYYKDYRRYVMKMEEEGAESQDLPLPGIVGNHLEEDEGIVRKQKVEEGFLPNIKGSWNFASVHEIMPKAINEAFVEGMSAFGNMIPGFDDDYVLVSGVESRTSSPVRILRDETLQSSVRGLYPCGEGAGYAGGITSAAMDGIKVAEAVAKRILNSR